MPQKDKKIPVTVLIPTKNESRNLPDCLSSVTWADEVVVIDSGSTDGTIDIAFAHSARVEQFRYQPGGPKKRNWALEHLDLRNEWILLLDADERVTPELREEISSAINDPAFDGHWINRRLIFMGKWIRKGGWYPSWNLRLFRRSLGRYEQMPFVDESGLDVEVHEHVLLKGRAGYLRHDLLHLDLKDLTDFFARLNKYSTWDAKFHGQRIATENSLKGRFWGGPVERKRFLKRIWVRLPAKPVLRFLYMYIFRLGFLEGTTGLYFATSMFVYEFMIAAKKFEQKLAPSGSRQQEGKAEARP